jgi:hypothetical protein
MKSQKLSVPPSTPWQHAEQNALRSLVAETMELRNDKNSLRMVAGNVVHTDDVEPMNDVLASDALHQVHGNKDNVFT